MSAEQLPVASGFELDGQTEIAGFVVVSETDGFEEDGETKQNANGSFKCDITYSRRKTKELTLDVTSESVLELYVVGGGLDADFLGNTTPVWEIVSCTRTNTRGPVQIQVSLKALTDSIPA